jgi:hypothetical protein
MAEGDHVFLGPEDRQRLQRQYWQAVPLRDMCFGPPAAFASEELQDWLLSDVRKISPE